MIAAGGVAGAVIIEAQARNSRCRKPIGKRPIDAVQAHRLVAERIAENDAGILRRSCRRVIPAEELGLGNAENDRPARALLRAHAVLTLTWSETAWRTLSASITPLSAERFFAD